MRVIPRHDVGDFAGLHPAQSATGGTLPRARVAAGEFIDAAMEAGEFALLGFQMSNEDLLAFGQIIKPFALR